jgi:hypothetical protein
MHFGENQLSRSLIGLSPLHTDHPPGFQPWWVRASTQSYLSFTLPMRRSLRFGSTACDSNALFRLAFATAPPPGLTSPHTTTRRLILQKARNHTTTKGDALTACRHTVSGTISQPLTGALFTFPSRYSSTIGHQGVFRLTRWSWQIHTGFLEPRATREHTQGSPSDFTYPALTVSGVPSQRLQLPDGFITPRRNGGPSTDMPHNPAHATPAGYHTHTV